MATCIDLAEAAYPKEFSGQTITPVQGTSLRPAFSAKPLQRTKPLFWEHEGNRAIRDGDWKLVAKGAQSSWELYNLAVDRTEMDNLAVSQPAKTRELVAKWESWAKESKVLPWPWNEKDAQPAKAKGKKAGAKAE